MKRHAALFITALLVLTAGAGAQPPPEALPLIAAGRYVEAQQVLAPYIAEHPEDLSSRYWYGRALLGVGQRAAAEQQFREILTSKPESVDSRRYLAQALYELRRVEEAKEQIQEILRRDPGNAPAKLLLDRINRNLGAEGEVPPELSGGRVAFINGGLPVDPGTVDLNSYNVKDYTFGAAPSDWLITAGTWATTSRWTCSPQWSWYGGYANNAPAAIWTKEEFSGDITVELYAAFKMGTDIARRAYKNPNDINLTICGDGGNLDSGYTFMLGGEQNSSTRIMRGDQVLGETRKPAHLLPSWANGQPPTYQFHRRWWSLRARKVGDLLQFYVDDELAVEVRDPVPLQQGRVAVWTYDNGIIVPRARIYYQQTVRPRSEPAGTEAWIKPVTELAPRPLTLSSPSHPALFNDFEYHLGTWKTLESKPPAGALLTLVPGGPRGKGHCLALIISSGGGHFGAWISEGSLDARRHSRLAFDYRLPAEAKVNFYLATPGKWWEIIFTGLPSPSPQTEVLGRIPGVLADNQWHHAEFDLLGALQAALGSTSVQFSHLHVGNFNPTDYLLAGFGGNPAGCTWYLDNFYLGTPSEDRTLLVEARPASEVTISGCSYSVDQDPHGVPSSAPVAELPTQVTAQGPGQWYLHLRPVVQGAEARVVTFPFRVDDQAPRVVRTTPPDGSALAGGEIVLHLDPGAGSGFDPRTVKLEVNGQELVANDAGLSLDPQEPALRLDPAQAGLSLEKDQELQVTLVALKSRAGVALAKPVTFTYRYDPAAAAVTPPAPKIALPQADLVNADFEQGLGGITAYPDEPTIALARDSTTAASGNSSLRVTNLTTGGGFGVRLAPRDFDAGKYRLLSFDYKFSPSVRVDLAMNVAGQWQCVRMTDTDSPNVITTLPDVAADGQWRHVELDIFKLLQSANPRRTDYRVSQLVLTDLGFQSNSKHAVYHLDNIRLSPLVSAHEGLTLAWQCPALGGIQQLGYTLSKSPESAAAAEEKVLPATNPLVLPAFPTFDGYLHLRARDSAGRWSPVTTRRLLVESSPPVATILGPPENFRGAPENLRLKVARTGTAAIHPQSVGLSVGGTDYRVNHPSVVDDAATSLLTWYPDRVEPAPKIFADGQTVEVQLKSARDFAGNAVPQLPRWTWTMDYSKDDTGPSIQDFTSPSHPTFLSNTFEDGSAGTVAVLKNAELQVVKGEAAAGERYLKLRKTAAGSLSVRLLETPFQVDRFPVLAFDYKMGPQTRINVVAQIGDRRFVWAFSGPVAGTVGWVSGVKLDNQWHHAVVRLAAPLYDVREQPALTVKGLYLYEQQTGDQLPVGGEFAIDNLMVGASSSGPIVARWQAGDPTGIKGYSYLLTQDSQAQPPERVMSTAPSQRFDPVAGGVWFLRIRAQDGAGNWGPVFSYTLLSTGQR